MTFALAVVPIVLLVLGFPIFLVLLTGVTVALVFFMDVPLAALHQTLFASINAFALLAVPFFIYAGELMGRGSVAQRLVDFVQSGVGSVLRCPVAAADEHGIAMVMTGERHFRH